MADRAALLQQLGFSEYEARAYLALVQRNPLNGYELAKQSGLPRANVYAVLQKLEERGAVVRLSGAAEGRYAPIPADQLTERLSRRFDEVIGTARSTLQEISGTIEQEHVWNAQGYSNLLQQ